MSVHHPSPCENYPRPVSESAGKTHEGPQSFVQVWYRLQTLSEAPEDAINYCGFSVLRKVSSMPFTNAPESSPENFLARSTASFKTTLGGVSEERSSCMARRKIARSMA